MTERATERDLPRSLNDFASLDLPADVRNALWLVSQWAPDTERHDTGLSLLIARLQASTDAPTEEREEERIFEAIGALETLYTETTPRQGHSDIGALQDCYDMARDELLRALARLRREPDPSREGEREIRDTGVMVSCVGCGTRFSIMGYSSCPECGCEHTTGDTALTGAEYDRIVRSDATAHHEGSQ